MITPDFLKNTLLSAIQKIAETSGEYGNNMENFTRRRKLSFTKVVLLLFIMKGGSLQKELHENKVNASPSAFVQQRKKINSDAFYDIYKEFNLNCTDNHTFKGYRLLAVDGSCMSRNKKSESYVSYESNQKSYNQMHITHFLIF